MYSFIYKNYLLSGLHGLKRPAPHPGPGSAPAPSARGFSGDRRGVVAVQRLRVILRDIRAVSAVEFALAAPLLAGMVIPVVDLGMGLAQKMQVQDAAQAGAQYALINGWDSTGIQTAVTSATKLASIAASPAPSKSCGCATGTAVTPAACNSACPNGANAGLYVTVKAKALYTPLISYPTLGSSINLVATSTVRIDQ